MAARGRHNRLRLRRINDKLIAAGLSTQPSLTQAEIYRRQLAVKEKAKAANKEDVLQKVAEVVDSKKQQYLDRRKKREDRRNQSHQTLASKMNREIHNAENIIMPWSQPSR